MMEAQSKTMNSCPCCGSIATKSICHYQPAGRIVVSNSTGLFVAGFSRIDLDNCSETICCAGRGTSWTFFINRQPCCSKHDLHLAGVQPLEACAWWIIWCVVLWWVCVKSVCHLPGKDVTAERRRQAMDGWTVEKAVPVAQQKAKVCFIS